MGGGSTSRRRAALRSWVHGTVRARDRLVQLAADADATVDARGSFCPEPVVRTQERARSLPPGAVLLLLADDAGVEVDIPAWCISTGNEYLGLLREPDHFRVLVRVGGRQGRLQP